jgi:hypothetical protein
LESDTHLLGSALWWNITDAGAKAWDQDAANVICRAVIVIEYGDERRTESVEPQQGHPSCN